MYKLITNLNIMIIGLNNNIIHNKINNKIYNKKIINKLIIF